MDSGHLGRQGVRLKASLLSHGVRPTAAFLDHYGPPFLEKRRAYGNPDDLVYSSRTLPQELYLPGDVVCSVATRQSSPWKIDWTRDQGFFIQKENSPNGVAVSFPRRPQFYDETFGNGVPVNSVLTLYGGGSLGAFVYGTCALVDIGKPCQYCSIAPNRQRNDEFAHVITQRHLTGALDVALRDVNLPVGQVMINGGNFPDQDKSFSYYASLARAAREALTSNKRSDLELHLIVFPPRELGRVSELAGLDVTVAMNCEVNDSLLFEKYCPGKAALGGKRALHAGLAAAVEVLKPGNVHSIFVGGLEPLESLSDGLFEAAELGVTPVVNVFHADPGTPLASHPTPSEDQILAIGELLQRVYRKYDFCRPFYDGCGRNALDAEAHAGLF